MRVVRPAPILLVVWLSWAAAGCSCDLQHGHANGMRALLLLVVVLLLVLLRRVTRPRARPRPGARDDPGAGSIS